MGSTSAASTDRYRMHDRKVVPSCSAGYVNGGSRSRSPKASDKLKAPSSDRSTLGGVVPDVLFTQNGGGHLTRGRGIMKIVHRTGNIGSSPHPGEPIEFAGRDGANVALVFFCTTWLLHVCLQ